MKKGRAFTVSELLIIIVVITVLSAVILPQYKQMIEVRKAGEAEAVLTAVRTEQERRCLTGKIYAPISELTALVPSSSTKNFTYSDGEDKESLEAASKSSNYTLKMSSFRDGRICCSGEDCNKFNYPLCSTLTIQKASFCTTADADPTPSTPNTDCTAKVETEYGSCATYGGEFTLGGNIAARTKTTTADCKVSYSSWDISQCYFQDTNVSCGCDLDPTYTLGGNIAKCTIKYYANEETQYIVTNNAQCYKRTQQPPGSFACSAVEGNNGYTLGNATGCTVYLIDRPGTANDEQEIDSLSCNMSGCYKDESTTPRSCSEVDTCSPKHSAGAGSDCYKRTTFLGNVSYYCNNLDSCFRVEACSTPGALGTKEYYHSGTVINKCKTYAYAPGETCTKSPYSGGGGSQYSISCRVPANADGSGSSAVCYTTGTLAQIESACGSTFSTAVTSSNFCDVLFSKWTRVYSSPAGQSCTPGSSIRYMQSTNNNFATCTPYICSGTSVD